MPAQPDQLRAAPACWEQGGGGHRCWQDVGQLSRELPFGPWGSGTPRGSLPMTMMQWGWGCLISDTAL